MSIYKENIRPMQYVKPLPRVLFNIFYMLRAGKKAKKPFGLKFEVSSLCNLRCIMCPLSKGLKRKQGLLKFENFKKVFKETKPSYLNLTGIGEPLLNPELFRIIQYARKRGTIVKLDTNATLLDQDKAKRLLNTKINIVSISIDSIQKENYEKIRNGANFDSVIKNLKEFIKLRDEMRSKTKIHVNFVLQKSNVHNLLSYIQYMDKLGVDSINGDIALPLGENKNLENREIDKKILEIVEIKLKNLKTKSSLNIEHIEEFLRSGGKILDKRKKVCFYPWYYPSITWNGDLVPCCYICDNEIVFGNVFERPFDEVWNNKKIGKFRKMLAIERKGVCKGCPIDETYIKDKLKLITRIPLLKSSFRRKLD